MKVGSGVCPGGSKAGCESKDFFWAGTRNDQAVTPGWEACSICKRETVLIRKMTASVPTVVSLPVLAICWFGKRTDNVDSIDHHGMHPQAPRGPLSFLFSVQSELSEEPGSSSRFCS